MLYRDNQDVICMFMLLTSDAASPVGSACKKE